MSNKPSSNGNETLVFAGLAIVLLGRGIMFLLPSVWKSIPDPLKSLWDIAALIILGIILLGASAATGVEPSCFVATAVYESKTHPDVLLFKRFRDQILLKNLFGRLTIRVYYVVGPYLAKIVVWIGLKNFVHDQLSVLASWMRHRYRL